MTWAGWGNWYPKPERNRASRMSCEAAKAHAMQATRWHVLGFDGQAHVLGFDVALCGEKVVGLPISGAFSACAKCTEILQEIERVTA